MNTVQASSSSVGWIIETSVNLLKKVIDLVSAVWNKIWEAIKNFCCGSKTLTPQQVSVQPTAPQTTVSSGDLFASLLKKVDSYRNGRPLNEAEKADLKKQKEEIEAVFAKEESAWNQASMKERSPNFLQYSRLTGTKDQVEWLLKGNALESPEMVASAVKKCQVFHKKVAEYRNLGRPLNKVEVDSLKAEYEERNRLLNLADKFSNREWKKVEIVVGHVQTDKWYEGLLNLSN